MVGDAGGAGDRNSLQGTEAYDPAAASCRGTPLASRLVQQGSQTDLRVLSAGTRDFLLIGSAARDRPFSLHTSLLREKLSLLVRTLQHLCSIQE